MKDNKDVFSVLVNYSTKLEMANHTVEQLGDRWDEFYLFYEAHYHKLLSEQKIDDINSIEQDSYEDAENDLFGILANLFLNLSLLSNCETFTIKKTRKSGNIVVEALSSDGYESSRHAQSLSTALRMALRHISKQRHGSGVNYHTYIKSLEWKERAGAAKEKAAWRCQLCNRHKDEITLHAHHRTYDRLGEELPEDITVLCADCHAKFHDKL